MTILPFSSTAFKTIENMTNELNLNQTFEDLTVVVNQPTAQ